MNATQARHAVADSSQRPKVQHLARIDVLRAVAILLVFACHSWQNVWTSIPKFSSNGWIAPEGAIGWIEHFLDLGWAGVPLFFVISGFCIHNSFLKHVDARGSDTLRAFIPAFFWKRFWRIYPPYLVALLVATVWSARHGEPVTSWNFWLHALLFHNFDSATHFAITAAFWSLAVEWQFYLLYPAVLWGRNKLGMQKVFYLTILLSVASRLVANFVQGSNDSPTGAVWTFPTILLLDWVLGAVLAERMAAGLSWPALRKFVPLFALGFLLSTSYRPLRCHSFTMASLMFAGLMDSYLAKGAPLKWYERIFVPLGLCSFSFYLWHNRMIGWMLYHIRQLGFSESAATSAALLLFAVLPLIGLWSWLTYRWLELPSVKLGNQIWRRFKPSRARE